MENMESNIKKVYIVWYDNNLDYEDRDVDLKKVFTKEEDAKRFAEEGNLENKEFKPSYTREEYYGQDPDPMRPVTLPHHLFRRLLMPRSTSRC